MKLPVFLSIVALLLSITLVDSFNLKRSKYSSSQHQLKMSLNKRIAPILLGIPLLILQNTPYSIVHAEKEAPPSLEKCFNAVKKELNVNDKNEGESLKRLLNDINTENWLDLKTFTREYDAGFRGYVLKSAWKQIDDHNLKKKGIEISNSFTFDLIGLNKAARNQDKIDSLKKYELIKQDLKDFLDLQSQIKPSPPTTTPP